ncbi:hypothetical protein LRP88_04119 [Fusarium phalaenopsidis]
MNIIVESTAADTPAQNGGAELSGKVITIRARALRAGARFPHFLWVEIYRAAVYLYNRTPRRINNWDTPYTWFHTAIAQRDGHGQERKVPYLGHLRTYGSKAFAITQDALKGRNKRQRLNPRAWIGYLVGYQSTNIYRIWNPATGKVISTRDVIFDEDEQFNGDINQLKDDLLRVSREELDQLLNQVEEARPDQSTAETATGSRTWNANHYEDQDDALDLDLRDQGDVLGLRGQANEIDPDDALDLDLRDQGDVLGLRGQANEIDPDDALNRDLRDRGNILGLRDQVNEIDPNQDNSQDHDLRDQGDDPGLRDLTEDVDPDSIVVQAPRIEEGNQGKPREGDAIQDSRSGSPGTYDRAYLTPMSLLPAALLAMTIQDGSDPLGGQDPKGPSNRRDPRFERSDVWKAAFNAGRLASPIGTLDGEIIDKAKLQRLLKKPREMESWTEIDRDDPRTLGKQTLDCMWVYVYKLDKHGRFVKCKARLVVRGDQQPKGLDEETYAATLAGRSFRTLIAIAARFDLDLIQYDAVNAFVNARLDKKILMRMPPGYRKAGKILLIQKALYGLRESPLLWQKELIATLQDLGFKPVRHESCYQRHDTPMKREDLVRSDTPASIPSMRRYQRKIGSILYAAMITRPDVAFAASRLARFNSNPGPEHHQAADRVLLYLKKTKNLALQFGQDDRFLVASDASFADNLEDRKSSQAYVMRLFGGTIGWRANKQSTVTTSTTEAELLALSQAAKEAMFITRLVKELGIQLEEEKIHIQCDNQQTIRLIHKDINKLQTKLRHIDIHNHWLRQEAQRNRIQVDYIPTDQMIADGLTKTVSNLTFQRSVQQLGLVDISDRLGQRRWQELKEELEGPGSSY